VGHEEGVSDPGVEPYRAIMSLTHCSPRIRRPRFALGVAPSTAWSTAAHCRCATIPYRLGAEARFRAEARSDLNPTELAAQAVLLQEMFGNPLRPVAFDSIWRTPNVTSIAQTIYEERRFADMPILADALEEAGCASHEILSHCRSGMDHVLGCWALDLVLGKE
jgi:hypothetical protein